MRGKQHKAKRYSRIKEYINLISIPLEIIFLFLMIFFFSESFTSWAGNITDVRYLKIVIYGILFLLFHTFYMLPVSLYSGYFLEHRFELSTENIFGWSKFQLKSIIFSLLLGLPLLVLFYFILHNFPKFWWLISATCFFIISLFIGYILPFIISFFYKLKSIHNRELKSKIKKIIEEGGLKLEGVYEVALGARTKKANAALTGMGKTKRVLLSDTMINKFNESSNKITQGLSSTNWKGDSIPNSSIAFNLNEISSVTAHEVGHYVHHHIWKQIFLQAMLSYGTFYVIYIIIDNIIRMLSYGEVSHIRNFPVILLTFTILNLIIEPISNFFSRFCEYEADSYAAKVTDKDDFISSLNKLAEVNLIDKSPPPIVELLFHSHPSIQHRIEKIETKGVI